MSTLVLSLSINGNKISENDIKNINIENTTISAICSKIKREHEKLYKKIKQ